LILLKVPLPDFRPRHEHATFGLLKTFYAMLVTYSVNDISQ